MAATISTPLAIPGQRSHSLGSQGVAHKAAPLCPPSIGDCGIEIVSDQLDDLILKPLALGVREGQVVRIGADAQLTAIGPLWRSRG